MRRRFTEADRQRFYAELERSGETPWRVARRLGLNATTAYRWFSSRESAAPMFARVVRSSEGGSEQPQGRVVVEVGKARVIVEAGFEPALLRAVVDALSEAER